MSGLFVGFGVLVLLLAGAIIGWAVGQRLPPHNLSDETKTLVSVSMAVVATLSALVLGLSISSANTSFIARSTDVTELSASILRLDQMLRHYGREGDAIREVLRQYTEHKAADLFPEKPSDDVRLDNRSTYELLFKVETMLLDLRPSDSQHQWMEGQAISLAANIGNTRWLLSQRVGQGTPKLFIGLVVFWLTLLFASFGLFAPRNLISIFALALCALAVSGAIELILELERPFTGLVRISPEPMRYAVQVLSQ